MVKTRHHWCKQQTTITREGSIEEKLLFPSFFSFSSVWWLCRVFGWYSKQSLSSFSFVFCFFLNRPKKKLVEIGSPSSPALLSRACVPVDLAPFRNLTWLKKPILSQTITTFRGLLSGWHHRRYWKDGWWNTHGQIYYWFFLSLSLSLFKSQRF